MEEIKHHLASKKTFRFFVGMFILFFSLCLVINVGAPAHAISFPFLYLFGAGSYFVFAYFIALGFSLAFFKKGLVFKKVYKIIALCFLSLSILMLLSFIYYKNGGSNFITSNPFGDMNKIFASYSEGYMNTKIINAFDPAHPFGGGAIGYLFVLLFQVKNGSMNEVLMLTITILLFVIALLLFFVKQIRSSIKKTHHLRKQKAEKAKFVKEPEEETIEIKDEDKEESFDEEVDVSDDIDLVSSVTPSPITPLNLEQQQYSALHYSNINDGGVRFMKPEFQSEPHSININNEMFQTETIPLSKEVEELPISEEISEPSLDEELSAIDETPSSIEEEPEDEIKINEELVRLQPELTVPVVSDETNVIEPVPVVKKPIKWIPPSSELLNVYETSQQRDINIQAAEERKLQINQTLADFNVGASCIGYTIGPSVTRYQIDYGSSVSIKQVGNIVQDISLRLGGLFTRFEGVIEGERYSGLEVPNAATTTVGFKELFDALPSAKDHPLSVGFGKSISGQVIYADLDEFPHLLVSGTTGSGKSIYIHSLIATLIMRMSPEELRIVLVDPKKVEMSKYRDMPHLLCPIITESNKAKVMLTKLVEEMEIRYSSFEFADGSSNIKQYNEWAVENNKPKLPYIVVILDEYADLVDTCKDISMPVVSIAQKARAAGIHLVISTQRPSTNVITGVIKGNLPTRIALMTASPVDSVTIVGEGGAEKLLGKGDMLVQSPLVSRAGLVRLQGCYVNNKELNRIVGYLKEHYPTNYDDNFMDLIDHANEAGKQFVANGGLEEGADDPEAKYQSVKGWVMGQEYMSISKIQRECSVGFNRAGIFFGRLQKEGIVSMNNEGGNKGCKVLVNDKFGDTDVSVGSSEQIMRNNGDY